MTALECSHFELRIAKQLCDEIRNRYWQRYCWQLIAVDKSASTPDGEMLIELSNSLNNDNWTIQGTVARTSYPQHRFSFSLSLFDTNDDRAYFNAHSGCPQNQLGARLVECLRKQFFSDDAGPRLENQLKPIPVGQGIVISSNPPLAAGKGVVLLSWKNYVQFRHALFRFEVETQRGQLCDWLAKVWGRLRWGGLEVIGVQYQGPVPATVKDRGLVFLEKFDVEHDSFAVNPSTIVPLTDK
jgi:hypothetical protein